MAEDPTIPAAFEASFLKENRLFSSFFIVFHHFSITFHHLFIIFHDFSTFFHHLFIFSSFSSKPTVLGGHRLLLGASSGPPPTARESAAPSFSFELETPSRPSQRQALNALNA